MKPEECPFCSVPEAARKSGLSAKTVRKMCHEGRAPCIRSGKNFVINYPAFLEVLDRESRAAAGM